MTDLSGIWSLSADKNLPQIDMSVPGDAITALQDSGQIPDPYWGRNEYDLRWIADRDWCLRRSFNVTDTDQDLVLSGLDTVAEVLVNGTLVLSAANAFRSYRVALSDILTMGENQIEIRFPSVVKAGAEAQARQPFLMPYSKNCPIPNGNMLRKPACDFGWDWNIALAPFGLYGTVALEPARAIRITSVDVKQIHKAGSATLTIFAHMTRAADGQSVSANLCGQTVTGTVTQGLATLTLSIDSPDLWWPAGLGEQPLHDLTVTCGAEATVKRIGLRSMDLISEKDDIGRGFKFCVNGHDTFAKGANWIPADALAGRITPEKTRDLLQSAVDANMNMIRIWGGGRYEDDWFYDLCDEMGLMVWQDFMFACNIYPSDRAYLAEVEAEVREQVARLNHHACIALWCGDNELIGALSWYPETRANRDTYLVNYDRLNRTIENALFETAPHANWWPSSPSPGEMNFGDAWHDDSSGDMHFWSVWHEGRDFDHYRDVTPRFCSEFGFQSYPSMDVVKTFAAPQDWNIAAPVLESHQKNDGGNARIAETMFRYFRFPVDFPNFVYLSQIQQGLAIQTAVTQWRSHKPICMGALYWQLNDTWPVASWASLDYGGGWKQLHHMARRFFAPVTVAVVPKDDSFILMASNDTRNAVDLSLTVYALNMAGESRALTKASTSVGTDKAQQITTVTADDLKQDDVLYFTWTDSDGTSASDHFAPKPYKAYDLQNSDIALDVQQTGDCWKLRLEAKALSLFAAVECDVPGRFSDNAITLLPNQPVTLTFTPTTPGTTANFTLRDLYSATYGTPSV